MTTRALMANPKCEAFDQNEHLFGLAALDCLPSDTKPREGAIPVTTCDECWSLSGLPRDAWLDVDAANAVAERIGGTVEIDPLTQSPFVRKPVSDFLRRAQEPQSVEAIALRIARAEYDRQHGGK